MKRTISILIILCILSSAMALASYGFGTNVSDVTVQIGTVTLPLAEYPVGSYCTTDGKVCDGSNELRYYTAPDGTVVDTYGWQCLGFARYVFYRCFGVVDCTWTGKGGYYSVVSNVSAGEITVQYLKSLLGSSVLPGAHVRAGTDDNGHSMIYLTSDDNYVYTYEGNYNRQCDVTVNCRTWSELVDYLVKKGGIAYIHMPNVYPDGLCVNCPGASFTDMPAKNHWAHDSLEFMLQRGLLSGTSATTLSPSDPMTRSMLVSVLYRIAGAPEVTSQSPFLDVPAGTWYTDCVIWAAEHNIVSGIGEGKFAPADNITREQIAAILYRYAQSVNRDTSELASLDDFGDADQVSGYAVSAMQWAVQESLISGAATGGELLLQPLQYASRCEVASILARFVCYLEAE